VFICENPWLVLMLDGRNYRVVVVGGRMEATATCGRAAAASARKKNCDRQASKEPCSSNASSLTEAKKARQMHWITAQNVV
jgi:hypothetical protein